jgi:hypothetical protein
MKMDTAPREERENERFEERENVKGADKCINRERK